MPPSCRHPLVPCLSCVTLFLPCLTLSCQHLFCRPLPIIPPFTFPAPLILSFMSSRFCLSAGPFLSLSVTLSHSFFPFSHLYQSSFLLYVLSFAIFYFGSYALYICSLLSLSSIISTFSALSSPVEHFTHLCCVN